MHAPSSASRADVIAAVAIARASSASVPPATSAGMITSFTVPSLATSRHRASATSAATRSATVSSFAAAYAS